MRIGVWSHHIPVHTNNRIFTQLSSGLGDSANYGNCLWHEVAKRCGVTLATMDTVDDWSTLDAVFMLDYPWDAPRGWGGFVQRVMDWGGPKYLFLSECEAVKPNNFQRENWSPFEKIFTWHEGLIDGERFIRLNHPQRPLPKLAARGLAHKRKLACMVFSHKRSSHPLSLYQDRIDFLDWFEANHPEDLDCYGLGWDQRQFDPDHPVLRRLNRFPRLARLLGPRHPCWRGPVDVKSEAIAPYRFNLAFENARDIPGYVLDKMFDAFFGGCVPIYWGASDVERHIPPETFIDFRKMEGYGHLYDTLAGISDGRYLEYLEAIDAFGDSPAFYPYSGEYYVRTLMRHIAGREVDSSVLRACGVAPRL